MLPISQHEAPSSLGQTASSTLPCIHLQYFFRCPYAQRTREILLRGFLLAFHTGVLTAESTKINKMASESSWYLSAILVHAKPGRGPTVHRLGKDLSWKLRNKHVLFKSTTMSSGHTEAEGASVPQLCV